MHTRMDSNAGLRAKRSVQCCGAVKLSSSQRKGLGSGELAASMSVVTLVLQVKTQRDFRFEAFIVHLKDPNLSATEVLNTEIRLLADVNNKLSMTQEMIAGVLVYRFLVSTLPNTIRTSSC